MTLPDSDCDSDNVAMDVKLCLHMAFACPCAWKFNIVLMERQTQRMDSQPIFWNANVKCKHLHLVIMEIIAAS